MPKICYFEIPVEDMARSQAFYRDLFDWQFQKALDTPAEIDYWTIQMGTAEELGMPCAGMMKKQAPGHSMTPYIGVDSIETYVQKVEQLGGQVIVAKKAAPGKGYFALCLDLENNPLGLWVSDESAS